jgi:hypothetical protein
VNASEERDTGSRVGTDDLDKARRRIGNTVERNDVDAISQDWNLPPARREPRTAPAVLSLATIAARRY